MTQKWYYYIIRNNKPLVITQRYKKNVSSCCSFVLVFQYTACFFFCVIKPLLVIFLGASFHDFDSPMSFWDDKLKYLNDLWCAVYVFFFCEYHLYILLLIQQSFFFGFAFISFLQPPQTKIMQFYQGNTFFLLYIIFAVFV